jgi:hypothetical protein
MRSNAARNLSPTGYASDIRRLGPFLVNPTTPNNSPTDILLNNNYVYTTAGINAVVGQFSTIDADPLDTFTYSLVVGTGDTNNADFSITGSTLKVDDPNALGVGTYSIRVQTDDGSDTYAEPFTIYVRAPTASGSMVSNMITDMVSNMVTDIE